MDARTRFVAEKKLLGRSMTDLCATFGISRKTGLLIKHGIQHEISRPGTPTDNAIHERMHRTLREETAIPPAETLVGQQGRFDEFMVDFNTKRPHEALGQKTPMSVWHPSPRQFPTQVPEIEYEGWFHCRRVRPNGEIHWRGRSIFISEALKKETIGLEETHGGLFRVWFGPVLLGLIDEQGIFIRCVTKGAKSYPAYDPDNRWSQGPSDE